MDELELNSFELVHLQQIKENYDEIEDDFTQEFNETLRQIRMNSKAFAGAQTGGGFQLASRLTDLSKEQAVPTTSSE